VISSHSSFLPVRPASLRAPFLCVDDFRVVHTRSVTRPLMRVLFPTLSPLCCVSNDSRPRADTSDSLSRAAPGVDSSWSCLSFDDLPLYLDFFPLLSHFCLSRGASGSANIPSAISAFFFGETCCFSDSSFYFSLDIPVEAGVRAPARSTMLENRLVCGGRSSSPPFLALRALRPYSAVPGRAQFDRLLFFVFPVLKTSLTFLSLFFSEVRRFRCEERVARHTFLLRACPLSFDGRCLSVSPEATMRCHDRFALGERVLRRHFSSSRESPCLSDSVRPVFPLFYARGRCSVLALAGGRYFVARWPLAVRRAFP